MPTKASHFMRQVFNSAEDSVEDLPGRKDGEKEPSESMLTV